MSGSLLLLSCLIEKVRKGEKVKFKKSLKNQTVFYVTVSRWGVPFEHYFHDSIMRSAFHPISYYIFKISGQLHLLV